MQFDKVNNRVYGYIRVSTYDQETGRQLQGIEDFCEENDLELHKVYEENITGTHFDRPKYQEMKRDMRNGDLLVIHELDRLGRTYALITREYQELKDKGIKVQFLNIPITCQNITQGDEYTGLMMQAMSDILVQVFQQLAEQELRSREKRQQEGYIQKKKRVEEGLDVWDIGRPRKMDELTFYRMYWRLYHKGYNISQIARELKIARSTVYKYLDEFINGNVYGDGSEIKKEVDDEMNMQRRKDLLYELDTMKGW